MKCVQWNPPPENWTPDNACLGVIIVSFWLLWAQENSCLSVKIIFFIQALENCLLSFWDISLHFSLKEGNWCETDSLKLLRFLSFSMYSTDQLIFISLQIRTGINVFLVSPVVKLLAHAHFKHFLKIELSLSSFSLACHLAQDHSWSR